MYKTNLLTFLEKVRFRLLTRKRLLGASEDLYQPLPFLGIVQGRRTEGSLSRLLAIQHFLTESEIKSGIVVDYGCNVGLFLLSLGREGFISIGVEENEKCVQIALSAANLMNLPLGMIPMRVSKENIEYMPGCDVGICLSIWHHWVRTYGLTDATYILRTLFEKTQKVLFFDTGEQEMPPEYGLPFQDDARAWLEKYFRDDVGAGSIAWLGTHKAFPPEAKGDETIARNLFAIMR